MPAGTWAMTVPTFARREQTSSAGDQATEGCGTPGDEAITVLAVASHGGHWEQLMLLRPALEPFRAHYASTVARGEVADVHVIPDGNRNSGFAMTACMRASWSLVRRLRPDVVISTGAMPGLFCLAAGRLLGARTIWIDSVANSEQASLSGRLGRRIASVCLTQWDHLARPGGPFFAGSVI